MTDVIPAYQTFRIPLDTYGDYAAGNKAGPARQDVGHIQLTYQGNLIVFADSTDTNGNLFASAELFVSLGRQNNDQIPIRLNTKLQGPFKVIQVFWGIQPAGYIATLLISRLERGVGVYLDAPPVATINLAPGGTTLITSQGTVGATRAVLIVASATRQHANVRNISTSGDIIYIGGSNVTVANGFPIYPGETFDAAGTTSDIYGVAAVAGVPYATEAEQ